VQRNPSAHDLTDPALAPQPYRELRRFPAATLLCDFSSMLLLTPPKRAGLGIENYCTWHMS